MSSPEKREYVIGYETDLEHVSFPRFGLHSHRRYRQDEAFELLPEVREKIRLHGGTQWEVFRLVKVDAPET